MKQFSIRRMLAFMHKESLQMRRDPSSFLIAGLLPILLIFVFGYGVSLDANVIKIGLVVEDISPLARSLSDAFSHTRYFSTEKNTTRSFLTKQLMDNHIRGLIVIPQDFSENMQNKKYAPVQIIADGSETNTASFVENYAEDIIIEWWDHWKKEKGIDFSQINLENRIWFNPELKSRNVLLPGSIAVIMSLIGILLTALVVAREWERGTMETILSTPIKINEFVLGKLLPYFFLAMGSMLLCVIFTVFGFQVPFVGSFLIMILSTTLFLFVGLNQGLLISILAKNQFIASQAAINAAFLPTFMLSGFLYEIDSMPIVIQWVTYIVPARYYVSIIKTIFLAGNIWHVILPNLLAMLILGGFFLMIVIRKSKKSLE